MEVKKGQLVPADSYAESQLRARGLKIGDKVKCDITKLRSPGFNRLVHRIGQLVTANLDSFSSMDAHTA